MLSTEDSGDNVLVVSTEDIPEHIRHVRNVFVLSTEDEINK